MLFTGLRLRPAGGYLSILLGFTDGSVGKEIAFNAVGTGDDGSIPGPGRSPGGGHGNTFQCSYLENPMDRRLGEWPWSHKTP